MKEADRTEKIIIGKANTNRQKIQKDAHSQGQRFLHFSLTAAVRPLSQSFLCMHCEALRSHMKFRFLGPLRRVYFMCCCLMDCRASGQEKLQIPK